MGHEFMVLPQVHIRTDIHCIISWSKFGASWRGVSLDTLFGDAVTMSPAGFLNPSSSSLGSAVL